MAATSAPSVAAGLRDIASGVASRGSPGDALRLALLAAALGVAFMFLIELLIFLAAAVSLTGSGSFGRSGGPLPWTDLVEAPFVLWLFLHGAISGYVVLTGLLWIGLSFRVARRAVVVPSLPARGVRTFALSTALMSALIYAASLLAVGIVMRIATRSGGVYTPDVPFSGIGPTGGGLNVAASVVIGAVVAFAFSIQAVIARSEHTWSETFGLPTLPRPLLPAWRGGFEAAKYCTLGMLAAIVVYLTVVTVQSMLSSSGDEVGGLARALLAFVIALVAAAILLAGADIGVIGTIFAMRLFLGGDGLSSVPAWLYVSLLIPLAACLRGGFTAARVGEARDRTSAALAGMSIGPVTGALFLLWALVVGRIFGLGGGIVPSALFLPILWGGVLGSGGGLLYASQMGLPVSPPRPSPTTAAPADGVAGERTPVLSTETGPASTATPTSIGADDRPASVVTAAAIEAVPVLEGTPAHSTLAASTTQEGGTPVTCATCGSPNPSDHAFCGSCGARLEAPEPSERVCPACGRSNPVMNRFCGGCGGRLVSDGS